MKTNINLKVYPNKTFYFFNILLLMADFIPVSACLYEPAKIFFWDNRVLHTRRGWDVGKIHSDKSALK